MVEASVRQLKAQCILPIDPAAHRVSCLSIGEARSKLEECDQRDQREAPRGLGVLTASGEQRSKHLVVVDGIKGLADADRAVALRKGGLSDASGLLRDCFRVMRMERHGGPPKTATPSGVWRIQFRSA